VALWLPVKLSITIPEVMMVVILPHLAYPFLEKVFQLST
jgi:hypothetical protein